MNQERFGGIYRLYGIEGAQRLKAARVAIVGIGGVGTWVAEALARTGIGHIILMDMDDICITNTNRQTHAHDGNYGKLKTEAMAERLRLINPDIQITEIAGFYSMSKPERLFDHSPDIVIDAIDSMKPKAHLIASCYERKTPCVTCGGAGGRIDASLIRIADLTKTQGDKLLSQLRKSLRNDYQMPLHDKCAEIGIPCVYSPEKALFPQCDGSVSHSREAGQKGGIGCASGFGSSTHITGTFGFMMAGAAINTITQ